MLCLRRVRTNADGLDFKLSVKSAKTCFPVKSSCKELGFSVRVSGSDQSALNTASEKVY